MTVSSVSPSSVSPSCESRPLLLVPAGGLANRMRAVASALALARDAGRCTRLYLATDDEGVKAEVLARYGRRVVTAPAEASRGSVGGIRDGLADMLTLARTSVIYGSAGSSFSEMAARIGGVPLEVLRQSR